MQNRFTTVEVAERLLVSSEDARLLIKFLISAGYCRCRGERPRVDGRGRSVQVYSFEEGFEKMMERMLTRGRLT